MRQNLHKQQKEALERAREGERKRARARETKKEREDWTEGGENPAIVYSTANNQMETGIKENRRQV